MLKTRAVTSQNALVSVLNDDDSARFHASCARVTLQSGTVLESAWTDITHVYFPDTGVLSIEGNTANDVSMQIAMIGREGASGMTLLLGNTQWGHSTVVQAPAVAWAMETETFRQFVIDSPRFRNQLLRYAGTLAGQIASTALANGRSTVPERLARWILQMHSRIDGQPIEATHDRIAETLGVRRPGITDALHVLEGDGLIRSTRGQVEVLDRQGLIRATGGCYRRGD